MADVLNQDDELSGNEDLQKQNASSGGALVGASSAQVGAGAPGTAGVGKGGTGGYTNIQAYLGANQGDTGSAQNLQKTVGSQFDTEANNISGQANDYVSNAQKQLNDNTIDPSKADQYVKDAAGQYSYGGSQGDAYKQSVNKVQGALNNAYTGPTEYNYALDANTQNYGSQLKDPGGFDTLMNTTYGNAAGKNLSQGEYQLQKQFDVGNKALDDTRSNLLNQYSGLETQRDNTVADTTTKLGGLAEQYRNNQSALKDYLYGQANNYDTAETQAETDAKKAYGDELSGASGRGNAWYGVANAGGGAETLQNAGIWGGNLSYGQLQQEQDIASHPNQEGSQMYNGPTTNIRSSPDQYYAMDPTWLGGAHTNFVGNNNALQDFYKNEDTKYANTGDDQKRSYNAIQDFLNTTAARKDQGFKVRG